MHGYRTLPAILALATLALAMLACGGALAADSASSSNSSSSSQNGKSYSSSQHSSQQHHDQDDARDALRRGKVMPLTAILENVARRQPGTVMEVELETEDGRLTYKIDVLSDSGRKVRLRLDARNGEILKIDYR